MLFKRKTGKRLAFPFLKTRRFNFQLFWNNLSQMSLVPCQLGLKKSGDPFVAKLCQFEDFTL